MNDDWRLKAECVDAPSEWFFAANEDAVTPKLELGLALCRACAVRRDCLDWSISTNQRFGMWGGKLGKERGRIRRRRLGMKLEGRERAEHSTDLQVRDLLLSGEMTAVEVADRLDVSTRTVQRSVRNLAVSGVPVYWRDVYAGRVFFVNTGGPVRRGSERVSA